MKLHPKSNGVSIDTFRKSCTLQIRLLLRGLNIPKWNACTVDPIPLNLVRCMPVCISVLVFRFSIVLLLNINFPSHKASSRPMRVLSLSVYHRLFWIYIYIYSHSKRKIYRFFICVHKINSVDVVGIFGTSVYVCVFVCLCSYGKAWTNAIVADKQYKTYFSFAITSNWFHS